MTRLTFSSRLVILVICMMVAFGLYFMLVRQHKDTRVNLVLRYDDFATGSSDLVEKEMIRLINEYGFSCSFGIIPYTVDSVNNTMIPLDPAKINMIKNEVQKGSIEVCQHGYNHQTYVNQAPYSEFNNMPPAEQSEKMAAGKKLLETGFNVSVNTFIPPWNTYDENTIKVLTDLNITNISGDLNQHDPGHPSFSYLPFTALFTDIHFLLSYKKLPAFAKNNLIVLMIHDYDFTEINPATGIISIGEFRQTMKTIDEREWNVISIKDAASQGLYNGRFYNMNHIKQTLLSHLNPIIKYGVFFKKLIALHYIYLSPSRIIILWLLLIVYYFMIFMIFTEILYHSVALLFSARKPYFPVFAGISIVMVYFCIRFWNDDHTFGNFEFILIVFIASLLFSILNRIFPADKSNPELKSRFIKKLQ